MTIPRDAVRIRLRLSHNKEPLEIAAIERQIIAKSGRQHFGKVLEPVQQLVKEDLAPVNVQVFGIGQIHIGGKDMVGLKTERNILQGQKTTSYKPRTDQKDQRQRNLSDDQNCLAAVPLPPDCSRSAALFSKRSIQIRP